MIGIIVALNMFADLLLKGIRAEVAYLEGS